MSTIPIKRTPAPTLSEPLEERLRRLQAAWETDTAFSSSTTEICGHWAFQEIIALGDAVVPLMLRDLEQEPQFWVWALPRITGANPVPAEDAGNIAKMSEAWVRWGREHGYRW